MKKIICLILILLVSLVFVSCGETETDTKTSGGTMIQVEHDPVLYTRIFVDRDTRVCYLCRYNSNGGPCITVMLDADGSPKLWEGDLD